MCVFGSSVEEEIRSFLYSSLGFSPTSSPPCLAPSFRASEDWAGMPAWESWPSEIRATQKQAVGGAVPIELEQGHSRAVYLENPVEVGDLQVGGPCGNDTLSDIRKMVTAQVDGGGCKVQPRAGVQGGTWCLGKGEAGPRSSRKWARRSRLHVGKGRHPTASPGTRVYTGPVSPAPP